MDILTLSLAVQKVLRELGVDVKPSKLIFSGISTLGETPQEQTCVLTAGETYRVCFGGNEYEAQAIDEDGVIIAAATTEEGYVMHIIYVPDDSLTLCMGHSSIVGLEVSVYTTATIHPIKPEYLPGVCLPVVELETVLASSESTIESHPLNDADIAALAPHMDSKLPVIVRARNLIGREMSAVLAYCYNDENDILTATTEYGSILIMRQSGGDWIALLLA